MNIFVRIVEALAWPVTAIVIVLLLRLQIEKLLGRLSQLKFKDVEATFGQQLREAEADLRQAEDSQVIVGSSRLKGAEYYSDALNNLTRISQMSPSAGIAEAWRYVELAARKAADTLGITMIGSVGESQAIHTLVDKGILSSNVISLYQRLRQMRAEAVHSRDASVSTLQAENYIELALRLALELDAATKNLRDKQLSL
jgi:hypothetical protein